MNHYDLSTRHAGVLVAITSTVGSIGAVLVPMVAGELAVGQVHFVLLFFYSFEK